jgi:hypothetical protein
MRRTEMKFFRCTPETKAEIEDLISWWSGPAVQATIADVCAEAIRRAHRAEAKKNRKKIPESV